MPTILLVNDDDQMRRLCQTVLEEVGYRVLTAESGPQGLRIVEHQDVDLAVIDMFLPSLDSLEVIELLHVTQPALKIIATSGGAADPHFFDTAKRLGANVGLTKPFSPHELLAMVSSQLK